MAYEPRKAAQLIAALILKNEGQMLNILKAIKLVYIIDRESIKQCGFPVLDEPHYSLPHGPVNSCTYNHINGECRDETGWSDFLTARENHCVGLANNEISLDDLDELSDAEISYIDDVWARFGSMDHWDLVEWTHNPDNVPEWEDPNGSALFIPLQNIMNAVGLPDAEEFLEAYEQLKVIDSAFERARGI